MNGHPGAAPHEVPACRCCGKPRTRLASGRGWRGGRGWCHTCYERWRKAGKPEGGPPPRVAEPERIARITLTCREAQAARVEDYAWLRAAGEIPEQAARRVGVTARTATKVYERLARSLRAEQEPSKGVAA